MQLITVNSTLMNLFVENVIKIIIYMIIFVFKVKWLLPTVNIMKLMEYVNNVGIIFF